VDSSRFYGERRGMGVKDVGGRRSLIWSCPDASLTPRRQRAVVASLCFLRVGLSPTG
jgi:hypothetical protein